MEIESGSTIVQNELSAKTLEEVNIVNSIPAVYANRLYLSLLENGLTRLSFCEEQRDTGSMVPRAALLLSDVTLINLMSIIKQIMDHKNNKGVFGEINKSI